MSYDKEFSFIDLFAGCGGLSLGLFRAGWNGLFGVEKDTNAFETLSTNLLADSGRYRYEWPTWLPQTPHDLGLLLEEYEGQLRSLNVDLLVGGPPCQGFSSAGRRDPRDPRNALLNAYLEAVSLLRPKYILIENVRGITMDFLEKECGEKKINYSKELLKSLADDYNVWSKMLDSSTFGVPQSRVRFFVIAQRKDISTEWSPFDAIEAERASFLRRKSLLEGTTAWTAISDLEVARNGKVPSRDTRGFEEISYSSPLTHYQRLMRDGMQAPPSDTRLARHRPHIVERFAGMIELCQKNGTYNTSLRNLYRERFGLKKQAIRVMDPDKPTPTITSMPDDLLHYTEPRALTVRENARLQSFPDWFEFRGKYTSGGHRRKIEVPRFTQVANAVPPLVAEAIGRTILMQLGRSATAVVTTSGQGLVDRPLSKLENAAL